MEGTAWFSSSTTLCWSRCEILPPYFFPSSYWEQTTEGQWDLYRLPQLFLQCSHEMSVILSCRNFFFHLANADFMPLWVCFCLECAYSWFNGIDLVLALWAHLMSIQNSDDTLVLPFWTLEVLPTVSNIRISVINEENLKRLLHACEMYLTHTWSWHMSALEIP